MTISRRQARRQALFLVYQWDLAEGEIGERYGAETDPWAKELAEETVARAAELDERITAASVDWPADRLGTVERSALRVAIRELDRVLPAGRACRRAHSASARRATRAPGRAAAPSGSPRRAP